MTVAPVSPKVLLTQTLQTFLEHSDDWPQEAEWVRLEVFLDSEVDLLLWLAQQKNPTKWYWRSRSTPFEVGAIGESDRISGAHFLDYELVFQKIRHRLSKTGLQMRYYGGFRFNENVLSDSHWQAFGSYFFVLPQFELLRNEDMKIVLAYNFYFDPKATIEKQSVLFFSAIETLSFEKNSLEPHSLLQHTLRQDLPSREGWAQNIQQAIALFEQKKLEKVVLARKTIFSFSQVLKPLSWLLALKQEKNDAFYFCFQLNDSLAFLGASPELLYRRQQRYLESEAIAGTRKRGQEEAEDQLLGQELLQSEKDLREHHLVYQRILAIFQRYCQPIENDSKIRLLKLSRVQHLYHQVRGTLAVSFSDGMLLKEFHPTPAVGGTPREKAISVLTQLEPFDRGWYAAPVGWIGKDAVEFAVAIRSGLFEQDTLSLFTGAGIVSGSDPALEWDELENKMKLFRMRFL